LGRDLQGGTFSIKAPQWADLVKTGSQKEMAPSAPNWWYIRAASILRQVYLHPDTSVGSLKTRYGSNARNGTMPAHFHSAGGKIIRTILQQLESVGLVEKDENKGGRHVTSKGQKQLDLIAKSLLAQGR
jgi:small subunit ribosomal protein S19e